MQQRKSNWQRLVKATGSSWVFWGIIVFFVLETLWLVFSAIYPMAFDEGFHFGIIKIYSHHWLPFLTSQPNGASSYGSVVHDPSYLYQYLMSFPYRLIRLFTADQTIQVICLRLINVGLFTGALVLFRKVMLRAKLSPAFTNLAIFLFVLIPVVPLLAAEINYDNLVILGVAWTCLLMEQIMPAIQKRQLPIKLLSVLAAVCLLSSIVKYAFLPIFAATALILIVLSIHSFGRRGFWRKLGRAWQQAWRKLSPAAKMGLPVLIVISLGLFSQRYIFNVAAYRNPIPRCNKILSTDECMSYGPFARNYIDAENKSPSFHPHYFHYVGSWFYGSWFRLFFVINGNVSSPPSARFQTFAPLPLPSIAAVVIAAFGLGAVLIFWRKLFHDWFLVFFGLVLMFYVLALFLADFSGYLYTGQQVAINGRYLIPVMLIGVTIIGRALQLALNRQNKLKAGLAIIAAVLFIQGGGVLPFMLFSDHNWLWPNHTVQAMNRDVKHLAKDWVIYDQPIKIFSP